VEKKSRHLAISSQITRRPDMTVHDHVFVLIPLDVDFYCDGCGEELTQCECNALPPYRGSDPTLYDNNLLAR
jgi:hypothetical protein